MDQQPATKELDHIKRIAYHCYGYQLTEEEARAVWRIAHRLPVTQAAWPPPIVMRRLAREYSECIEAKRA